MSNKLFKLTRLSENNRPAIGEKCFFSPVIRLTDGVYIDDNRPLVNNIKHNDICTITKHGDRIVHVTIKDKKHIVSYDFLLRFELTSFGKTILEEHKNVSPN